MLNSCRVWKKKIFGPSSLEARTSKSGQELSFTESPTKRRSSSLNRAQHVVHALLRISLSPDFFNARKGQMLKKFMTAPHAEHTAFRHPPPRAARAREMAALSTTPSFVTPGRTSPASQREAAGSTHSAGEKARRRMRAAPTERCSRHPLAGHCPLPRSCQSRLPSQGLRLAERAAAWTSRSSTPSTAPGS